MNPAPAETAEILHRVRQQLILAQVRIMELEDSRDEKAGKLADVEILLASAQVLADRKMEEAGHLEMVRSDLQAQYEHMRHMQHVTNEALNATRGQLALLEHERDEAQKEARNLRDQAIALNNRIAQLNEEINESKFTASQRLEQINQLSHELAFIRNTRSWRWTAWLRWIGRRFDRRKA